MSGSGFLKNFKIKQCLVPGFILVPGFGFFLKEPAIQGRFFTEPHSIKIGSLIF
jgi:hypothetical protein